MDIQQQVEIGAIGQIVQPGQGPPRQAAEYPRFHGMPRGELAETRRASAATRAAPTPLAASQRGRRSDRDDVVGLQEKGEPPLAGEGRQRQAQWPRRTPRRAWRAARSAAIPCRPSARPSGSAARSPRVASSARQPCRADEDEIVAPHAAAHRVCRARSRTRSAISAAFNRPPRSLPSVSRRSCASGMSASSASNWSASGTLVVPGHVNGARLGEVVQGPARTPASTSPSPADVRSTAWSPSPSTAGPSPRASAPGTPTSTRVASAGGEEARRQPSGRTGGRWSAGHACRHR